MNECARCGDDDSGTAVPFVVWGHGLHACPDCAEVEPCFSCERRPRGFDKHFDHLCDECVATFERASEPDDDDSHWRERSAP